ncbi:hypothetical protein HN747_01430 [archaeon]|jgi:hypothetical protein|nr:hypothetical protein [archaeon]
MKKDLENQPRWVKYIGREITYDGPAGTVVGIFNTPDMDDNIVEIRPYIHQNIDGSLKLEKEDGIDMSIAYFSPDMLHRVTRHKDEFLEAKVKDNNKNMGKRGSLGFHQE